MTARAAAGKARAKCHENAADNAKRRVQREGIFPETRDPHWRQPAPGEFSARRCGDECAEDGPQNEDESPIRYVGGLS